MSNNKASGVSAGFTILQINVDRGSKAHDLVQATAKEIQGDIITCQEMNLRATKSER